MQNSRHLTSTCWHGLLASNIEMQYVAARSCPISMLARTLRAKQGQELHLKTRRETIQDRMRQTYLCAGFGLFSLVANRRCILSMQARRDIVCSKALEVIFPCWPGPTGTKNAQLRGETVRGATPKSSAIFCPCWIGTHAPTVRITCAKPEEECYRTSAQNPISILAWAICAMHSEKLHMKI